MRATDKVHALKIKFVFPFFKKQNSRSAHYLGTFNLRMGIIYMLYNKFNFKMPLRLSEH